MRKLACCLFIAISSVTVIYGQTVRVLLSPTVNCAPQYKSVQGGPGQNLKFGFTTSFDLLIIDKNNFGIGVGLNYHYCQVEFTPNLNSGDLIQHTETINLLSCRWINMIHINGTYYLSIDPSIDFHIRYATSNTLSNQSGIGLALGFGNHFSLKENLFLAIEPKVWIHNIIPFSQEELPYRLTSAGINIGLGF